MKIEKPMYSQSIIKRLGDYCNIILGQSPPSNTYNSKGIGLPFFQGKAEFGDLHPIAIKWCSLPGKIALPNDILISVRAPVGSTNIADQKCCIGRGLAAIRHKNYKYIYYFLKSIENKINELGTGTTFKAITGNTLKDILIPIPPDHEQHLIVEKIEELFSELEAGQRQLETVKQQMNTYRQAVLKWAFEGKLNKVTINELLWKQTKFGDVVSEFVRGPFGSSLKKEYFTKTGYKVYEQKNAIYQSVELGKYYISEEKFQELKRFEIKPNDYIISCSGTIGRLFQIPETAPKGLINQALLIISTLSFKLMYFLA